MKYYENPTEMFRKRAEKSKRMTDAEYSQYMNADTNSESANEHYLKSQHHYKKAEENEKKAKENVGKTWAKKRKKTLEKI